MRSEDFVGRPIDCPDCRQRIALRRDDAGAVLALKENASPAPAAAPVKRSNKPAAAPGSKAATASKTATPKLAPPSAAAPAPEQMPGGTASTSRLQQWLAKTGLQKLAPTGAPWIAVASIAVAAVGLTAVGYVFWPRSPKPNELAAPDVTESGVKQQAGQGPALPVAGAQKASAPGATAAVRNPAVKLPTAESRLATLGDVLLQYRKRGGHFPAGTATQAQLPVAERLSWLAELSAGVLHPKGPVPSWNEAWTSPRNERFVRQKQPEFLNPRVDRLVGPQNYPATHFIGVAGVGEDAASLPVDHERAGVFGNDRKTRLEDIRDGASNTFLVLGVTGEIGSWAAGGSATVRPLTREPYVNGPDGFGTGSVDRMSVLMADGSVREMSASTDPRIMRRLAAMADGLPLDPKVPGEPGDHSRPRPIAPPTLVKASPEKIVARSPAVASRPAPAAPAPVGAAPQKPTVDIAAGLRQRILRFEQPRPAALRDVLAILEEMVSVPIRGDQRDIPDLDDLLQTPVTFDLQNTTVGDVLKAVLAKAKLSYEVEADSIRLRKFVTAPINAGLH